MTGPDRHSETGGNPASGDAVVALLTSAAEQLEQAPLIARGLAEQAFALAQAESLTGLQGQAALLLGRIAVHGGAGEQAAADFARAQALFAGADDAARELEAATALGRVLLDLGDLPQAARVLTHAESLAGQHAPERAAILNLLARVAYTQGEADLAIQRLELALSLHRALGDVTGEVNCLTNLGATLISLGEYPRALAQLLEAYRLVRAHQAENAAAQATLLVNIGFAQVELGEFERARGTLERALDVSREAGDRRAEAAAAVNLGQALLTLGEYGAAAPILREALQLATAIRLRKFEALALDGLGRLQAETGDLMEALALHRQAVDVALLADETSVAVDGLINLAKVQLRRGQPDAACEALQDAREAAVAAGLKKYVLDIEGLLADAYEQRGDFQEALSHYRQFHALDKALYNEASDRRAAELADRIELERARHEAEVYRLRTESAQQARADAEAQVRERTQELELSRLEVVTRLALAAEYRDDVTGQHTWRVGHYAGMVAHALGLPVEDVELIRVAARLHDIGKIGIPDAILLKPGKFTPEEFARMKEHAAIGSRILSGSRSQLLRLAEVIALTHHERWDGSGYPAGLAGERIPLVGRIVAVADVLDALTHARPYKAAWTPQAALAELAAQRGRQFDPRVLDVALEVFGAPGFFEQLERDLAAGVALDAERGGLRRP